MVVASLVVAIAGVCIALLALIVAGRQWLASGPELAFDLTVIAYRHPGTVAVHRLVARIEVFGDGRIPAIVRRAELRGPGTDWIETDITRGRNPKLEPTESELSNGVEFRVPDATVQAMIDKGIPDDPFANQVIESIVADPPVEVRGRVVRGDRKTYTRPRNTHWYYMEEAWPDRPDAAEPAQHADRDQHAETASDPETLDSPGD